MHRKKLLLAALSSTLLIGAAAIPSFAAPGDSSGPGRPHRPRIPAEILYVRMLKQFDTNGDMKISKDELTAGVDKLFDQIDSNKDGEVTPGELRVFHQERMQAWRDAHPRKGGDQQQGQSQPQDQAQAGDNAGQQQAAGDRERPRGMRPGMMMRAAFIFRSIDTDESGQISKKEAEDAAGRLFARLDRNDDGFISLDDMPDRPFL